LALRIVVFYRLYAMGLISENNFATF